MSAATHLAKFNVTVEQASEFIFANVDQPEIIFDTAEEFAVTTAMLSEITQFSTTLISDYFASFNLDTDKLEDTHILINSDPGILSSLITLNTRTGILSNESLRGFVQQALKDPSQYDSVFGPQFPFQDDDGVYDAEELGVATLSNVPATHKSIESLFYGSLINMFLRFDQAELNQIIFFPVAERRGSDDFQAFVFEALSDIPLTVPRPDDDLAGLVVREAAILMTQLVEDNSIIGVLDQSFLGLAVA
jgi:hypothetical protein